MEKLKDRVSDLEDGEIYELKDYIELVLDVREREKMAKQRRSGTQAPARTSVVEMPPTPPLSDRLETGE